MLTYRLIAQWILEIADVQNYILLKRKSETKEAGKICFPPPQSQTHYYGLGRKIYE